MKRLTNPRSKTMTKNDNNLVPLAELRKKAEKKLTAEKERLHKLSSLDLKKLVHELRTHQIELEMQNEELQRTRAELESSGAKYANLYDLSPEGYFTFDKSGLIKDVNLVGAGMLGRTKRFLINKPIISFIDRAHRKVFLGHLEEVFRTKDRVTSEITVIPKDGAVFPALLQSQCFTVADEGHGECLTTISDITELKRSEVSRKEIDDTKKHYVVERAESQRESELKLSSLINAVDESILMVGMDGTILAANATAAQRVGMSVSEVLKKKWPDLTSGPFAKLRYEKIEEVSRTREPVHFEDERLGIIFEYSLYPVQGKKGAITSVVVFARDITERKRNEDTLLKTATRLQLATASAHLGIWEWDARSNEYIWDDRTYEYFDIKRDGSPITLEKWTNYLHPNDVERVIAERQAAVMGERVYDTEYRVVHSNGSIRVVKVDGVVVRDESGRALRMIGINKDITEQKDLEEKLRQAQKMEAMGQFAGGIAHDFNNILSAIIGYVYVTLTKMAGDDPQRSNIEQILLAAERAAYLTRDILLFSRKQVSERKAVDLNEIVMAMDNFLKRVISEDIAYKMTLQKGTIPILADMHQLEQVFMNLATNARDAMPQGGTFTIATEQIRIDEDFITSHGYGNPGIYALLTAADTGNGMDEQTQQRIFEPFFTTKEVGKGTGLGMAVVYGIIKQHDGYINVYSEPGKGTTFKIYLPVNTSGIIEKKKIKKVETSERGTETILLAEDNESLRNIMKSLLEDFGYNVIAAVDGEEAVKKYVANEGKIQLLLFDLIMPKKTGKEAYDEIKNITPDIRSIFLTGYAADIIQEKGLLQDTVLILHKPISPLDLLRKVRSVLNERRTSS
jgi:PAS domain S-box-containing protein